MVKEVSFQTFLVVSVLFVLISVSATVVFLSKGQGILPITGAVSGIAEVEVICIAAISMPVSGVNFGAVPQGHIDNTSDDNPGPMVIQNDGGIKVDVTIERDNASTPLFSGTGGGDNTSSFQFKIDNTNESNSFNYSTSITSWTNVPGTSPLTAIKQLKYSDQHDSAEIDLMIQVPVNEPIGKKNETLNFIAGPSEEAVCGDEACEDDEDCPEDYECEEGICVPEDEEGEEADCVDFDLDHGGMGISELDEDGEPFTTHCWGTKLKNVWFENTCDYDVTIIKIKVSWLNESGEKTKYIKMSPFTTTNWDESCYWGCSPTGKQSSGTLLDFGSRDFIADAEEYSRVKEVKFDSNMEGKAFNIELTFSDSSTVSTGNFSP